MKENVLDTVARWMAGGQAVALATVAETRRSAPLPVGTRLAVTADGRLTGAVSGGCVEANVVGAADAIIRDGAAAQLLRFGIPDDEAWEIGLPCGGEIAIWVEPAAPGTPVAEFIARARADERVALVRDLGAPDRALLIGPEGPISGSLGAPGLDSAAAEHAGEALWTEISGIVRLADLDAELFIEVAAPRPRLIIIGAVDFGAHLSAAARIAGWRSVVIDPRPRFAIAERFPDAESVIAAWPQAAFARIAPLDRASAVAVLTHDPKVDDAALSIALRSEAGYIGAMGSRPAQRRRRARLQEAGFADAEIDRIAAPIGLDLGAVGAGETALSIMAEIVALKHRRSGGRLAHADGRIHELPEDPRSTNSLSRGLRS